MKLGDLTKKLYQKNDDVEKREETEDVYDATEKEQPKDGFEGIEKDILRDQTADERSKKEALGMKSKMILFAGVVASVLVGIVLLVFFYYRFIGSAFLEERVIIEIEGSEEVQSAETATYKVKVTNKNRVDLNNCQVTISYPNEMVLDKKDFMQIQGFNSAKIQIGQIKAKDTYEFEASFESFGPRDRQVYLNASLLYQPSNFSSDFDESVQKSILIKSSPISLTIVPIQEAASGELAQIEIIAKNDSTKTYNNLELRVDYPEGFTFTNSDLVPIKDNRVWNIGSLDAKDQKKLTISGIIEGSPESLKKFTAVIGETRDDDKFLTFTEIEGSVKIVASRVEIIQKIQDPDKVYAGQEVVYSISFKNTSDVALRDLVLKENISSEVLDTSTMETSGGYYDSGEQAITWRAAQVPALKLLQPQESGSINFKIKILDNFPMKNENDKNFTIRSSVELESLDVNSPLWQNKRIVSPERIVKVNSKLILNTRIVYNDDDIPNTGPIPPRAKQETTFTVKWSLLNTSNDLKNTIIKTSMPPGVNWKNVYLPSDPGVEFNQRTNELYWRVGTLDAGTGFISPVKHLSFQIGVNASENQVGESIDILGETYVDALDAFTGNEVVYDFKALGLFSVEDSKGSIQPIEN